MEISNKYLERARLLLSTGRVKEAEKEVGFALVENPQDEEALLLLAECKIEAREHTEAIRLLHQCIHLDPENDRTFYLLGFSYYQQGERPTALDQLDQAIQLNPWNSAYFGLYAYILIEQRKYKEALQRADAGLAIFAEDLTCLNARSQALFRLNNKEEAYETVREALKVDPENDFTHSNYGWQFLEKGKHKKALEHFREALRINPFNQHARAGFKEALKANLPTYRIMLMYSLWLASKSKKSQWLIIIAVWLSFQVSTRASESSGLKYLSLVLLGTYLLFVVLSWIGNALANLYLSFHREGKYALSANEKYNSYGVGATLLLAILFLLSSIFIKEQEQEQMLVLVLGISIFALTVPLSQVEYPVHFSDNSVKEWATYSLLLVGFAGIFNLLINPAATGILSLLVPGYFLGLLVYMWTMPIMNKDN